MEYLGSYGSDSCVTRHVRMNLDQGTFQNFYQKTVPAGAEFALACREIRQHKDLQALEHLDRAIALDPRFLDAYSHRALIWSRQNKPRRAGLDYRESSKEPSDPARVWGGQCSCDAGSARGLRRLDELMSRAAKDKGEGIALFLKGDLGGADRLLTRAIADDPSDAESYQSRAVVREAQEHRRGAIGDYEMAETLVPGRPDMQADIHRSLARLREQSGDLGGAARDLRGSLDEAPAGQPGRRSAALHCAMLGLSSWVQGALAGLHGSPGRWLGALSRTFGRARDLSAPFWTGLRSRAMGAWYRRAFRFHVPPPKGRPAGLPLSVGPPRLGRPPAEYAWAVSELSRMGGRVAALAERIVKRSKSGCPPWVLDLNLSGLADYTAQYGRDGGLAGLMMPDLTLIPVSESDVNDYLGQSGRGRDLVAGLGAWGSRMAAFAPEDADHLGRSLAVYDLALMRLAARDCRHEAACLKSVAGQLSAGHGMPVVNGGDPDTNALFAAALSEEYAASRLGRDRKESSEAWRRWTGSGFSSQEKGHTLKSLLSKAMDQLWRRAQERLKPGEPWISGAGMADAINELYPWRSAGGSVLFYPKGRAPLSIPKKAGACVRRVREPWELIAPALDRDPAEGLAALSPEAADELAEFLAVMAGVAMRDPSVWEGAFEAAPPQSAREESLFSSVPAAASGLKWPAPEAPVRDEEAATEMPGGIAVLDFDGDGRPDLFICDAEQARLYRNVGGFRFKDVTDAAGLSGVTCDGASSADFNNDGWPDLLTLHDRKGRDHLFRNEHGRFVDVTAGVGLPTVPARSRSAVWFDYDRDGKLDLYIVAGGDYGKGGPPAGDARNGGPNRLYHNLGGRFEETAARAGVADTGWGLAAASFDFDGDGWPDLYVVNDFGRSKMFRNQGDGTFREVSAQAGVDTLGNGMGVSVADWRHDGRPGLFVTYIGDHRPGGRFLFPDAKEDFRLAPADYIYDARTLRYRQRDRLFRNVGGGRFEEAPAGTLEDVPTGWGWSGLFLDAGNRGWQDVYQINGWWPYHLAYGEERKVFWRYDPAQRRFRDASAQSGADFIGDSRVAAYADFNGDGCLDLVVTGFHAVRLFAGRCPKSNHWLALKLEGTRSNRDGIGAKVTVRSGALTQTAELGPQGGGFQSSLLRELHFGLGSYARADSVEVHWPSGLVSKAGPLAADRTIVIRESPGDKP
jgi:Tfp pilus assembly protein PilF